MHGMPHTRTSRGDGWPAVCASAMPHAQTLWDQAMRELQQPRALIPPGLVEQQAVQTPTRGCPTGLPLSWESLRLPFFPGGRDALVQDAGRVSNLSRCVNLAPAGTGSQSLASCAAGEKVRTQ